MKTYISSVFSKGNVETNRSRSTSDPRREKFPLYPLCHTGYLVKIHGVLLSSAKLLTERAIDSRPLYRIYPEKYWSRLNLRGDFSWAGWSKNLRMWVFSNSFHPVWARAVTTFDFIPPSFSFLTNFANILLN